jgi:hypothetical protein
VRIFDILLIYMFPITSERRQLPAPDSMRSMGSVWLDRSLRQRILLYIFQTQDHHGFREGAIRHGVFVMIWMSQSSVRGYSAAVHVIRLDTRINVVQIMMLAPVLKRPPIREDLKVLIYQSQEADNTFITTDGTSPYNSSR